MTTLSTHQIMGHMGTPGARTARLEEFIRRARLAAQSKRAAITFLSADDIHAMAQLSLVATDLLIDIRNHAMAAAQQGQCLSAATMADYINGNLPQLSEIIHGQDAQS